MQATKQQQLSPAAKKSSPNGNSECPTSPTKSAPNNMKSVAQRVMEVAVANGNALAVPAKITIEASDQEVEDITNRASKKQQTILNKSQNDINSSTNYNSRSNNSSSSNNSNSNSNNNNNNNKSRQSGSTSSLSLLLDNQSNPTSCPLTPSTSKTFNPIPPSLTNLPTSSLISGESLFRQVVSNNQTCLKPVTATSDQKVNEDDGSQAIGCKEKLNSSTTNNNNNNNSNNNNNNKTPVKQETRITLDTKVPHFSESEFKVTHEQEEVSYYNDQASSSGSKANQAPTDVIVGLKNQQQATNRGKHEKVSTDKSISNDNKRAAENHNLSIVVPKNRGSRNNLQLQINGNTDFEDDYETRYDNATVEIASAALEQQRIDSLESRHWHRQASTSNLMSNPTSPKAKSAPATPCNVTPTAFHQNTSHLNAMLNPNPANTMPPDIRKNITERQAATCRVLHSSVAGHSSDFPPSTLRAPVNYLHLDELYKQGQLALEAQDYEKAARSLSQCISLATSEDEQIREYPYLKKNYNIYCQRAEAYFYLANYNEAIEDARAAHDLNPKCTQAYYLQGRAQFSIGLYADCLAAFSFGLLQDPTSKHLFEAIVEAALKSDLVQADFKPKYAKLKSHDLHNNPFLVVSVLGQELLFKGYVEHSIVMLESVVKIENKHGTANKKLIGSVLSTLSYAFFLMKHYDKAISYMKQELQVEKEMNNIVGQCRVLSNMGHTYYKMRNYDESIEALRKHNHEALKTSLFTQVSAGLHAAGHVHVARNDFNSALTSHSRCLDVLKQLGDNDFAQFKELLSIGYVYTMLNDFNAAEERYNESIRLLNSSPKISQELQNEGFVMVYFNLAYLSLRKQSFSEAKKYYDYVLKLANSISAPKRYLFEMRVANALGQANRLFKNFGEAKACFENQLELAEKLNDKRGQNQAICNLGLIGQHGRLPHRIETIP